ncbi:hypothetical protein H0E87_029781 [Populus deltoides]|uniref:Glycine cleavage system P-protein N-terminal domain-containing protein n=1 Tax=Populus deltoides TaxID=3696 RepID=A0A8T2WRX6_POPDE|nr:hypothetical protein H0E87_029781 [Populus deltoides]
MERARRLANRAILKRLVNGSKQSHNQARNESSLLNSSSSVSCTPSSISHNVAAVSAGYYGVGSQIRSISVESLKPNDHFPRRHNSATPGEQTKMAELCGFDTLDSLIDATVPKSIRLDSMKLTKFDGGLTESQMIEHLKYLASKNKVFKSYIGMGYYDTHVTPVILTNIMENPAWYTQYTPSKLRYLRTRAGGFNLKVVTTDLKDIDYISGYVCGVLVQYPGTEGEVLDYGEFIKKAHARGVKVVMASDLLALTMLKPPGELGADIVIGSAQRFGVPMGYAFWCTRTNLVHDKAN